MSDTILFNPHFAFATDSSPALPSPEAAVVPTPILKIVDNLIETYRGSSGLLDDEELKYKSNLQTSVELNNTDANFTDIVRLKNNRANKKKDEERFPFTLAVTRYKQISSFIELNLSKSLLKALTEMSLDKPTPIQCACIPVALLNHDICACARTGSGKTLAFLLPILERMTKRPSTGRTVTQALVISPTRELAIQIYNVAEKLVKYCPKLRVQLAAGGLDLHSQEASLRLNPDLVIATPGRLIDHLSNAPNFNLQHIEYLVLDEADNLLDEYFTEQIAEIVRLCGKKRQTLLFSATMTDLVKELAVLSLRDPVQIFLNQATAVAKLLQQEFVRIRPHREGDRQAILLSLLIRNFNQRTIVFLPTKKECHRMYISLGLLGLSCAELHGDMTQAQRLDALQRFTKGRQNHESVVNQQTSANDAKKTCVDILLATDLASRGLDIPNVQTVINYKLPKTMKQYVHRVGRTARMMNVGRAVSLVCESDRKLLKQIMKEAPYPVKARVIAADVIVHYQAKVGRLQPIIDKILTAEEEERNLRAIKSQLDKAENLLNLTKSGDQVVNPCVERRVNWFAERKRKAKEDKIKNKSKKFSKSKKPKQ